jgi:hypothetical protein
MNSHFLIRATSFRDETGLSTRVLQLVLNGSLLPFHQRFVQYSFICSTQRGDAQNPQGGSVSFDLLGVSFLLPCLT